MFTDLGASSLLPPDSVTEKTFEDTAIALVEGYLLFNRDLMMASVKMAKQAGAMIALDLASYEVVNASMDILPELIKEYVDILIANEDEAKAYTGESDETAALEKLSADVTYAVLKVGSRGSFVWHDNQVTAIEPVKGNAPVDTTGAGDLWAAAFYMVLPMTSPLKRAAGSVLSAATRCARSWGPRFPRRPGKKSRS